MKFILLILSLFSFSLCQYIQLKKHSSVKVKPGTKVYLDLSSFEIGELISFEIEMLHVMIVEIVYLNGKK